MTLRWIVLGCLLSTVGCLDTITEKGCPGSDMKGGSTDAATDMGVSPPKCTAAAGLAGTNLACVDFSQVSGLTDPKLAGWDFATNCGGMNWTIATGQLQIKNFSTFASTCGFTMPALNSADYQKYNSFTLSVVHTVDLNKLQLRQSAAIYLGVVTDTQQVWLGSGTSPRQVSTITLAKTALPNGGTGMYQPLFQAASTAAGGGFSGWQIESIAVMGNP